MQEPCKKPVVKPSKRICIHCEFASVRGDVRLAEEYSRMDWEKAFVAAWDGSDSFEAGCELEESQGGWFRGFQYPDAKVPEKCPFYLEHVFDAEQEAL